MREIFLSFDICLLLLLMLLLKNEMKNSGLSLCAVHLFIVFICFFSF
jgi:hypothetical protein